MIKGVIFDMDGVLINSEVYYFDAFIKMLEDDGKKVDVDNFKTIVGKSHEDSIAMLGEYYDGDFDENAFFEKFDRIYRGENFNYKDLLFPYVAPLLSTLKEQGYKIALASSSLRDSIFRAIEESNIESYFEAISSGEDFDKSKPHPEIYLTTAKKLGLQPSECIAIEDSFYGIKSAKTAGMKVIARKDEDFDINQESADFIVRNLITIPTILDIINRNNNGFEYKIFNYGSKLYLKNLFLRNEALKKVTNVNIFNTKLTDEKDDVHFGIFNKDEIVSAVTISEKEKNHIAQIKSVVVNEKYRSNGIGTDIMKSSEMLCKSLGYKKIYLKANESRLRFFKKLGYNFTSEGYILPLTNSIHFDMYKNI